MIPARHTWIGNGLCRYYSGYKLDKNFRPIRLVGEWTDNDLPILLIANHFCWWDGFIQYRLNREIFRRRFHVMMLEEQLRRHKLLHLGGAFSIRKGSRQLFDSLAYTNRLLSDKHNLVLLFPQGEIQSLHTASFRFQKGIEYLLKKSETPVQLVFNVNLVDYFSAPRPSLSVYYQPYDFSVPVEAGKIEEAFNEYVVRCKAKQQETK